MSDTQTPAEQAQKIVASVLKATQRETKQAAIATAIGMPESTLSRLLSDHLEKLALVMAHAGLRVVGQRRRGRRAAARRRRRAGRPNAT